MKYRNHLKNPSVTPNKNTGSYGSSQGILTPETNLEQPLIDVNDKTPIRELARGTVHKILTSVLRSTKYLIVNVPKVIAKWPKGRQLKLPHKPALSTKNTLKRMLSKKRIVSVFLVALVAVGVGLYSINARQESSSDEQPGNQPTEAIDVGGKTPEFSTLLPSEKSIETLGGWTRVSPPDRNPVFAFVDTIGSVKITVSQQPLPSGFTNNTDEDIKEIAQEFGAVSRAEANDGTVFFVSNSADGPQSVILKKSGNMILIKSPVKINDNVWSAYIANLD